MKICVVIVIERGASQLHVHMRPRALASGSVVKMVVKPSMSRVCLPYAQTTTGERLSIDIGPIKYANQSYGTQRRRSSRETSKADSSKRRRQRRLLGTSTRMEARSNVYDRDSELTNV